MDFFVEPELLSKRWSQKFGHDIYNDGGKPAKQDCFVVDYLLQSYKNHPSGAILNVEQNFNIPLQIFTFLRSICTTDEKQFSALILCPDESLVKWHYYASQYKCFHTTLVTEGEGESQNNVATPKCAVFLVNFSRLKLLQSLMDYDFSALIIDTLDAVATKSVIRKLYSNFNIGITYRNFYICPDQKLQWAMLNWVKPRCVGKLGDFYKLDKDNFAQFRDSYRQWWFRLTWAFCDSFVKPCLEEIGKLNTALRAWAKLHNLEHFLIRVNTRKKRVVAKRKVKQRSKKEKKPRLDELSKVNSPDDTMIHELPRKTDECDKSSPCNTDVSDDEPGSPTLKAPSKAELHLEEDESDVFLKSVATNNNSKYSFCQTPAISEYFTRNNISPSPSEIDLELMERRVFKTEVPSESDSFLKEICSQSPIKMEVCNKGENNIIDPFETTSEVDALVADVMKLVR